MKNKTLLVIYYLIIENNCNEVIDIFNYYAENNFAAYCEGGDLDE